jgi:general stress protein 26
MEKKRSFLTFACLVVFSTVFCLKVNAQTTLNRDSIIVAAQEIIKETTFCALATIDSTGQPHIRTMNPFPANDELITWFATSMTSRKVREIKNNPKVCVYYANHNSAKGYVAITGIGEVIDDKELLIKMKRDYWNGIPNWQNIFVLIKITPKTMEVINYKHGLNNDPNTFKAPSITF